MSLNLSENWSLFAILDIDAEVPYDGCQVM